MNEYVIHIGKVGTYGETKHVTWRVGYNGPLLAETYEKDDGTVDVILYNSSNVPFKRNISSGRDWHICEAHAKERGFTTLLRTSSDIRAYND